jgi:hypothetical protein
MAVPVWPLTVPYEQLRDGAGVSAALTPGQASATEGGPEIMRPRSGPRATEIAFRSKPWSGAQYGAFDAFLQSTLRDGTLIFEMPVFKPGSGYVNRKCQIKGGGGAVGIDESSDPWFFVSFTLIVFNW